MWGGDHEAKGAGAPPPTPGEEQAPAHPQYKWASLACPTRPPGCSRPSCPHALMARCVRRDVWGSGALSSHPGHTSRMGEEPVHGAGSSSARPGARPGARLASSTDCTWSGLERLWSAFLPCLQPMVSRTQHSHGHAAAVLQWFKTRRKRSWTPKGIITKNSKCKYLNFIRALPGESVSLLSQSMHD